MNDSIICLYFDDSGYLWAGTSNEGLIKMDTTTGNCLYFKHNANDSNSIISNTIYEIAGTKTAIWSATQSGLDKMEKATGKITHYLQNNAITSLLADSKGGIWAGTPIGLYGYNAAKDNFELYDNPNVKITHVQSVLEDHHYNIWVRTFDAIYEICSDGKAVKIYNADHGYKKNSQLTWLDYISSDDEIFIGEHKGYYRFYPDSLKWEGYPPYLNFFSLQIGGKEINSADRSFLNKPLYYINEIRLPNNRNSFSVGLSAIDFRRHNEQRVIYMMENYDNQWHESGPDKRAYYYNLPAASYVLRVRAIDAEGAWSEKTLSIIITPPWWQTW
jgi:hypothetical protein